jgi:FKBP-type peptidyl-prolyl cis-trans isomerase
LRLSSHSGSKKRKAEEAPTEAEAPTAVVPSVAVKEEPVKPKKAELRPAKKPKKASSMTTYRNGLSCEDLLAGSGKKAESGMIHSYFPLTCLDLMDVIYCRNADKGKQVEILYTGTLENGKVPTCHCFLFFTLGHAVNCLPSSPTSITYLISCYW